MIEFLDFFLKFLSQFAGGPGPVENNLVRFGLPAVLWAILLYLAWSRQRSQNLPREKLLAWGFGLALVRELYMFSQTAFRLLTQSAETPCEVMPPVEHGLAMAAMIVVAGAFLLYILQDQSLARRYLTIGLGLTIVIFAVTAWAWPRQLAADPQIKFHQNWSAWLFHIPLSLLIASAIGLLWRKPGWLRNTVAAALGLYLLSELLLLLNFATDRSYNTIICPIGNSLHILVIPLLAYVYLREQAIEKKQAENELIATRDHLEELVSTRTAELTMANASLATQNALAATLSQSLDIEENLKNALVRLQADMEMEIGLIFLTAGQGSELTPYLSHGPLTAEEIQSMTAEQCALHQAMLRAFANQQTIAADLADLTETESSLCKLHPDIRSLVCVPLLSKGRAIGLLSLASRELVEIPDHKQAMISAVGLQIGMAIENARMFKESEIWATELARLQQASASLTATIDPDQVTAEIARQSAWLLRSPKVAVLRRASQNDSLELAAQFGLSLVEQEILVGALANWTWFKDWFAQPTTQAIPTQQMEMLGSELGKGRILSTPVWSAEKPGECILILAAERSEDWTRREIELIESLANRSAVALVNARLHRQLELAAALEERQRIAANMHDGLAQTLSSLGMRVDRMQEMFPTELTPGSEGAIREVRETVNRAVAEVRQSIASLQETPRPRRSLQQLLQGLLSELDSASGSKLALDPGGVPAIFLRSEQAEQVLAVVQEALLNALHHAQAQTVLVSLVKLADQVQVSIRDDGIGFDPQNDLLEGDHFGLSIMQARAARIGGRLTIDSAPGKGTRISLSWTPESPAARSPLRPPGAGRPEREPPGRSSEK
jgi:nitrate/nitrite-specific signal transduction histidine kinase